MRYDPYTYCRDCKRSIYGEYADCDINIKDTVTGTATAKSYNVPAMQGWICPVCGRGVSPYTAVCPCKNGEGWQGTS